MSDLDDTLEFIEATKYVGAIRFSTGSYTDVVVMEDNGDIYVKGKLITNDLELVDGLREWFLAMRTR